MNVQIVYFSGTGNTKTIALGYERVLNRLGHNVLVSSIEDCVELGTHDVLIIGGPIYAGNMPDELITWVRKHIVEVKDHQKAIVFSTSAGLLNANGVKSIGKKLSKKGYSIVDTPTFEMPRNFYIDKYDPTPEDMQKLQFEKASEVILESIKNIDLNKDLVINESVIMIDILADVFRIMAKSMGKSFAIDDTCIRCGKCEKNCPKQNINFKDKKYDNKCILCTRCIHNCPVNAISYKNKKIQQYHVHHTLVTE
jgi:ferredoxin